jgi:HAD superfamily hydrolase (TIGR01509 family)
MRAIRGVILDIDGTLLDSNDAHANAYVDALAEEGLSVSFQKIRALIGMGSDKLLPAIGVAPESRAGEHVQRRKKEIFKSVYLPGLRPTPGARDLLSKLKKEGIARVVATSAGGDEVKALLEAARVDDLIEEATSSSDAESSKPDPDILQAAVRRARLAESDLVMIGDTPYDVAASLQAGVMIVAVRCGGWGDRDLDGAYGVYDDPADIVTHYDEIFAITSSRPPRAHGDAPLRE